MQGNFLFFFDLFMVKVGSGHARVNGDAGFDAGQARGGVKLGRMHNEGIAGLLNFDTQLAEFRHDGHLNARYKEEERNASENGMSKRVDLDA